MQLQDLPPELLEQIFSFACTDSGVTGCSLSLVSRYIHDISAPTKLQSVALLKRKQLVAFAALLARSESPPPTRFLYIGSCKDGLSAKGTPESRAAHEALQKAFVFGMSFDESEKAEELRTTASRLQKVLEELQKSLVREAVDAFFTILRRLALTLEVLSIHVSTSLSHHFAEFVDFPRLGDLTISTAFPLAYKLGPTLNPYPELRHLHISGIFDNPLKRLLRPDGLAYWVPKLTALQFSDLGWDTGNVEIPIFLATSLGVEIDVTVREGSYTADQLKTIVPLPDNLREVILQPIVEPPEFTGSDPRLDNTWAYYDFVQYARRLRSESSRVVLLQTVAGSGRHLEEWLSKADGNLRSWDKMEKDEKRAKWSYRGARFH
ncbi:hypothetical protein HMN09_00684500 [Mycena chlorophos]|uniref:F-box domain-containing protein n=1 Tax=Mycena chlorophos TaxID=658473 RepID=A0A8H6SY39_MYCCL|nr:hypothetical protein HMN09_00684500 [Mycena chlorophos]